jgi:hypothetical protein
MAFSKRGKTALAATAIAVLVAAAVVVVVVLTIKNKNQNKKWSNLNTPWSNLNQPWSKIKTKFIPDPDWSPVPNASTTCGATQSLPKISAYYGACTGGTTSGKSGSACEYTTLKDAQDGCDADGVNAAGSMACSGVIGEHIKSGTGPVVNHFGLVDATKGYSCVTKGTKNIQHSVLYQRTV